MNPRRLSRLESRSVRRYLIAFALIPALASVVAAAVGAISAEASVATLCTAILVLLALLVDFTLQMASDQHREVRAYRNDDEAIPEAVAYAARERPRTADLLEYSSLAAMPLLAKLAELDTTTSIRLLVAHPDAAITPYQCSHRLAEGMRALAYRVSAQRAGEIGLEVRCYSERASLRGRRFDGGALMVGWYTYDDRGQAGPGEEQIAGGSNVVLSADREEPVGEALAATFARTFENLWREAVPADEAWLPYRSQLTQLPGEGWFRSVSPRARATDAAARP